MSKIYKKYASVITDLNIGKPLDYGIPDNLLEKAVPGARVHVPIRGKLQKGFLYQIKDTSSFSRISPINKILSEKALITKELFELALWMSNYYLAPLTEVIASFLPSPVKGDMQKKTQKIVFRKMTKEQIRNLCQQIRSKKPSQAAILDIMLKTTGGILLPSLLEKAKVKSKQPIDSLVKSQVLLLESIAIDRSPLQGANYFRTQPKQLNHEQKKALEKIILSLSQKTFQTHLIHGVTGSGKTEIYLQAIDYALKQKKGIIMLVPEISLTEQTIQRFKSRFDEPIAVLHHRLSAGERFDQWHQINEGKIKIVIGARSAIFSPIKNLGLIVVDEEHESSYKQQHRPHYQARDIAVYRGKLSQATVILGSATPSLESYTNAINGKYTLSKLGIRADSAKIPTVKIVDMRQEYEKKKGFTLFSYALEKAIRQRCDKGEQTILFLNRRGYHTFLLCKSCEKSIQCRHCDVSLTFHKNQNVLTCHLCGYQLTPPPTRCPTCKSSETMKFKGVGTEQAERALHSIIPEVRTIRVDADTTKHKGSLQQLLRDFGSGKADVLIGTQMIAKGLHFPQVTLVGVLNTDAALNLPDFRASENVFQLITQVAGRAGRGVLPGEVIIQTSMPDNPIIQLAAKQDYEAFYKQEIDVRKMFRFPPFTHFVKFTFSGKQTEKVLHTAHHMREQLIKILPKNTELLPIVPCGHTKIKDHYRFQFLINTQSIITFTKLLNPFLLTFKPPSSVNVDINIDPASVFF